MHLKAFSCRYLHIRMFICSYTSYSITIGDTRYGERLTHMAGQVALRARMATNVPPQAYFLVSAVFHYLGPAFAVLLFAHVATLGVAWLRIASAALIFAVWRRPWRAFAGSSWAQRRTLLALGATLGAMNATLLSRHRAFAIGNRRRHRVPRPDSPRGAGDAHAAQRLRACPGGGRGLAAYRRAAGRGAAGIHLRVRQLRALHALRDARPSHRPGWRRDGY